MKKLLGWFDKNILTVLTAVLIVLIPLYPKIPLADIIPGYIVRLRLEDIVIAVTCIVWLVQVLRGKARFAWEWVAKLIVIYLVVGAASSISAVFVTKTVTMDRDQLEKLALNFFRRVEYFSLFFIAYSGIRSRRDLKLFVTLALSTLVAVVVYGFGQKYYYWPAFSTMNREFSKGMLLYLTPESRVMSTFGGHYDFAAYLMMMLAILIPAFWLVKRWPIRLLTLLLATIAYWSLIMTASRTSFVGYIVAVTVLAILLATKYGKGWATKRWLGVMVVSMVIMLTVGDLSTRFFQVIQDASAMHQYLPWIPTGQLEADIFSVKDTLMTLQNLRSIMTKPVTAPPKNGIAMNNLEDVTVPSDTPPVATKPLPPDVTAAQDAERLRLATMSATASTSASTSGGYSPNAIKYGLSVAIRLDAQWPLAIAGFKHNPLLGTGYSTLSKTSVDEFTDAESTDNDFLRMLGETGLLGTLTFLAIPGYLAYLGYKELKKGTSGSLMTTVTYLGAIGVVVGLLVNATYIDVFESSKVAYTLWLFAAMVVRTAELSGEKTA